MNGNPRKLAHANLLLNSIWGLFSLALLLLVFYSTGQKEHIQTQEQLFYAADEVTVKLD